jgi:methyl-accepting chemotaxis protein
MASEQLKGKATARTLSEANTITGKSDVKRTESAPLKGRFGGASNPPAANQTQAAQNTRYQRAGSESEAAAGRVAANDDMPSIGGLIYALQQRPSRNIFYVALGSTIAWVLLCGGLSFMLFSSEIATLSGTTSAMQNPIVLGTAAALLIPIALFWFLALLIWRAQELKLMASAMSEVAVRLAEPDRHAEQSVASVGQTIRRQVAAVNDAISRALGRAGELEALLHNEIATLERSYNDNELRVRALINELSSERKALANNSDQVSAALKGLGAQVSKDIAQAGDQATKTLATATSNLADTLTVKGEKITAAVSAAGAAVDKKLAERGAQVTEQLVGQGRAINDSMSKASSLVTSAILDTSDKVNTRVEANQVKLLESLTEASERVEKEVPTLIATLDREQVKLNAVINNATQTVATLETAVGQRIGTLDASLSKHANTMQTVIGHRMQEVDAMMTRQTHAFDDAITKRSDVIRSDLIDRIKGLDTALVENTHAVEESLSQHTADFNRMIAQGTKSFRQSSEHMTVHSGQALKSLASQADMLKNVSKTLIGQIHGLTQRFENQGQAILSAAQTLDSSNARIDSTLERRHAEISSLLDTVGSKAQDLDKTMRSYSDLIETSVTHAESRAKELSASLAHESAAQSQNVVAEIERFRNDAVNQTAQAAKEIKTSFQAISGQMADQVGMLTTQFGKTAEEMRATAHKTADDIEVTRQELQRRMRELPQEAKLSRKAVEATLAAEKPPAPNNADAAPQPPASPPVSPTPPPLGDPSAIPPIASPPMPPATGLPIAGLGAEAPRADFGAPTNPPEALAPKTPASPNEITSLTSQLAQQLNGPGGGQQPQPSAARQALINNATGSETAPPAGEPQDRREQWSLGDLLARASEAEREPLMDMTPDPTAPGPAPKFLQHNPGQPAKPAQPAPQPQQAASPSVESILRLQDLASAIDHRTAAEIWQRFRRGEKSVLNRQLYTNEGRAAFDEISGRYARNADFRVTVDRYMSDFERLLRDAEAKDADGRLLQNYLSSETGRVYLMLAHASGRLA